MAAGLTVCRSAVLCSLLALALLAVATQGAKKEGAGGALNEKVSRAGSYQGGGAGSCSPCCARWRS